MLQSGFTSVLKSRNKDELQEEVVGFTRRLGFETVSATVVIDHLPFGNPDQPAAHEYLRVHGAVHSGSKSL